MAGKEYFISGIDTNCGKTYTTGQLAYQLKILDKKVITTKLIQTGCTGLSEDILEHRRLMKSIILPEDNASLTCPYVLSFPASPHLSEKIDNIEINISKIRNAVNEIKSNYEIILSEGAGGLMAPIKDNYFTIDYIKDNSIPLILISSSRLGSINHTLLSLEICKNYNIDLRAVIYNRFPNDNTMIAEDSFMFIKKQISKLFPNALLIHSDTLTKKTLKKEMELFISAVF